MWCKRARLSGITHHRLQKVESEWSDQTHHDHLFSRHLLGHDLWLARESVVTSDLAKAFSASQQNVVCGSLGQEEEEEDQTEGRKPHEFPWIAVSLAISIKCRSYCTYQRGHVQGAVKPPWPGPAGAYCTA